MIYLDYAANTPVDEEVLDTFVLATKKYIANPNSSHPLGKLAKAEIDKVSKQIADYFNTNSESVIYTSGSSESNNLVLKGIAETRKNIGNKIIISAVEHSSIVAPCNYLASLGLDVSVIPLTKEGVIDLSVLEKELDNMMLAYNAACDSINKRGFQHYSSLLSQHFRLSNSEISSLPKLRFSHASPPKAL